MLANMDYQNGLLLIEDDRCFDGVQGIDTRFCPSRIWNVMDDEGSIGSHRGFQAIC